MVYLIDSDWVIDFLKGRSPAIQLVGTLVPSGIAISIISYMEVMEGIRGNRDPAAADQVFRRFLVGTSILGVTLSVAERAADIRLELRRSKRQINERALDMIAAATALDHGLALVTRNTGDYADIAGLRLHQPPAYP